MILDGRALAAKTRAELKARVEVLRAKGIVPRLDVVVASQDPASVSYVAMKRKWAAEIGIEGQSYEVTDQTSMFELLDLIARLNADPLVHGVLVQHPLPKHLDENEILLALGAKKDVDGMTPESLGKLVSGIPGFHCATPLGMMRLLEEYKVPIEGKRAVVVGRSVIVGKPMALLLLQANATVTIAHSRTADLAEVCREADILVLAVGKPELITAEYVKPGAAVLDAGYNRVPGRKADVGDVHFESVEPVAGWITPVPGGVGPMTVASLLANTVDAAEALLR